MSMSPEDVRLRIAQTQAGQPFDVSDPAYQMSMPSKDPANALGYYQWANTPVQDPQSPFTRSMEHPLRRTGFNPAYDVYVPPSYDPLNMGARTRMWGATLPAGSNWREARDRLEGSGGLDEKAATAMYKYLSESPMSEEDRSNLKYSDQTTYFNEAVRSQDRPGTVAHETTHRGISKMADEVWGPGYLDQKTNMLMTRVMDYKYGNEQMREKAVPFIKALSLDGTLEGGVNQAMPLINELTEAAKESNPTLAQETAPDEQPVVVAIDDASNAFELGVARGESLDAIVGAYKQHPDGEEAGKELLMRDAKAMRKQYRDAIE